MLEKRIFATLGGADHGWLNAKHHFSFANYYDPKRMHWGLIRVWNDDRILPQSGFPMHPHDNMEIVTYVRNGAISHQDNLGNKGRTDAGDVQVMSAGRGILHSEFNLTNEETTLFQIWIYPNQKNVTPRWDSKPFPKSDRSGKFIVLASGYEEDNEALFINANARVLGATLAPQQNLIYTFKNAKNYAYLVVAQGRVKVNGVLLNERDGLAIHLESTMTIQALDQVSELVMVDTE